MDHKIDAPEETVEIKMRSTAIAALIAESSDSSNLFKLPQDDVPEPDVLFEQDRQTPEPGSVMREETQKYHPNQAEESRPKTTQLDYNNGNPHQKTLKPEALRKAAHLVQVETPSMNAAVTPKHEAASRKVQFQEDNPKVSSELYLKQDANRYAEHSQAVASKSSVTDMSVRRAN